MKSDNVFIVQQTFYSKLTKMITKEFEGYLYGFSVDKLEPLTFSKEMMKI